MKRLVIAVDCDDVLVSTAPYFVDTYNNTYGTSGTLEYAHSPDPSVWGASEEVTEDLSDMPIVRCRDWREVEAEIERIASN